MFVRCLAWLFMAAVAVGLSTPQAQAADGATGTIEGRILNLSNGRYLSKALVKVDGTNIETLTNDFGEYTLREVPVGDVKITVTFTGQEPKTVDVIVEAGKTAEKDVGLNTAKAFAEDGTIVLDAYVVEQQRYKNAAEIAVNEERRSVVPKSVVSADMFGDIPAGNVGEFVKFMPGVLINYGAYGGGQNGYSENEATGVVVRGFDPSDTGITIDGMPISNAFPGSLTRQIGLDMMSINNASRVELIKVATPDMPANSIGGVVNLVTKSAFEYSKPTYSWRLFLTANSEALTTNKTPGPTNEKTYKLRPSADFSVAFPLTTKMGFSVTIAHQQEWNPNHKLEATWTRSGSARNANGEQVSLTNPYLQRLKVNDSPNMTTRQSANFRFDIRPFSGTTVNMNVQGSRVTGDESSRQLDIRVPNSGSPFDWGRNYTYAASGGRIDQSVTSRDKTGNTLSGYINWTTKLGPWEILGAISRSQSTARYDDEANGHFSTVDGVGMGISAINVNYNRDWNGIGVLTRNAANTAAKDYTLLSDWTGQSSSDLKAKSGLQHSKDTVSLYRFDVKRELDFLPGAGSYYTLSVKTGVRRDEKIAKKWGRGTGYYRGLRAGATYSIANTLDANYLGVSPGFGMLPQQWVSPYSLYAFGQANNIFVDAADIYAEDLAGWQRLASLYAGSTDPRNNNARETYTSWVNQNKAITETRDAWYAQLEGSTLKNRLSFVAGLRQEENKREGFGPQTQRSWQYLKNPDGTVYIDSVRGTAIAINNANSPLFTDAAVRTRLDAAGIAYPDHWINVNNLEGKMLELKPMQRIDAKTKGDPSYTISTAYSIIESLVARVAWSRSFGQISLEDAQAGILSGNGQFTVQESTDPSGYNPDGTRGSISVANPTLKPNTSTNWDFGLTYYTKSGGKVGVSYFMKSVSDFQQSITMFGGTPAFDAVLNALGLDPYEYREWKLSTNVNGVGTQKTSGWELEAQQNFAFVGSWAKGITAFASYTHNNLGDPVELVPYTIQSPNGTPVVVTPTGKSISKTANRFASGGVNVAFKRFSVQLKGTYRNKNEVGTRVNVGTTADPNWLRTFEDDEMRFDVSTDYRISERLSVFAYARDVFNNQRKVIYKDDKGLWPDYAELYQLKEFGIQVTAGIRGTF